MSYRAGLLHKIRWQTGCEVELYAHLRQNHQSPARRNELDIQMHAQGCHDSLKSVRPSSGILHFLIESDSKQVARKSCTRIYGRINETPRAETNSTCKFMPRDIMIVRSQRTYLALR